jgi:homoserine kinase type II
MAVFTPVTKDDLYEFLRKYDLGELESFEGIEGGVSNTNYHVFTTSGRYVLTIFEERRTDLSAIPFFFAYSSHLGSRGINSPQPVLDREGMAFSEFLGKPAAFMSFLEGHDVDNADLTPDMCGSLGAMLAKMHIGAEDFDMQRPNSMGIDKWCSLFDELGNRVDEIESGLGAFVSEEIDFLKNNWPADLPREAVHFDVFPDNVFFKGSEAVAVIDFSFSCTDFFAFDLAIVINAWCFGDDFVFIRNRFESLLEEYQKIRPLSGAEKENMSLLCRGAAMRVLSTRIYDLINHDPESLVHPHDPKEYIAKLRFHKNERISY